MINNNFDSFADNGTLGVLTDYPDVLTVYDAKQILCVSRNMMYQLMRSGSLPGYRLGKKLWRINKTDLIMFLQKN